jgi:hypothetical protein
VPVGVSAQEAHRCDGHQLLRRHPPANFKS